MQYTVRLPVPVERLKLFTAMAQRLHNIRPDDRITSSGCILDCAGEWGADDADGEPEFVHAEECLFCLADVLMQAREPITD